MRQAGAIGAFIIILCTTVQAAPKKIAVLELRNSAGLKDQEVAYITDLLRKQALTLPQQQYVVMTKENILEMMPPGTDLNKCEGQCEVETGRNVGADYVVTGEVIHFGKNLKVSMKMHNTKTSVLVAQDVASASTVEGLEEPVGQAAQRMLFKLPSAGGFLASPSGGNVTMSEFGLTATDIGSNIVNPIVDQTGYLFVGSKPAGATVLINGEEKGQTPYQAELMIGDYVVLCTKGNLYFPSKQEIKMTTKGMKLNMDLAPNFGSLRVTSGPANAGIELNGEATGQRTPFTFQQKPSGKYIVKLTKDLYLSTMREAMVAPGKEVALDFTLEPNFGSLKIESDPQGIPIYLDGQTTEKTTPTTFASLPAGLHQVEVRSLQYVGETKRVDVKRGQSASLSFPLKGRYGLLKITSVIVDESDISPASAKVWINDRPQDGDTPFKEKLLVGSYRIRLEADEARAFEATVQIEEGKTVQIDARLNKLLSAEIVKQREERRLAELQARQRRLDAIWMAKVAEIHPRRVKLLTTGILLLLGGAGTAAGGIYLETVPIKTAMKNRDKAYAAWTSATDISSVEKFQSAVSENDKKAKTYNWMGWTALGLGAAMLAGGAISLYFTPPLPDKDVTLVVSKVALSTLPWISKDTGGIAFACNW